MSVAPATSSLKFNFSQITSSESVKKSSHTMATPRKRYKVPTVYRNVFALGLVVQPVSSVQVVVADMIFLP